MRSTNLVGSIVTQSWCIVFLLIGSRSHFVSRAKSVQVNIVAVSDHVFHRFPCFFSAYSFSWLTIARLRMQYTLPCLVRRRHHLQMLVLLTVLLLTLRGRPSTMEEKITVMYLQQPLFLHNASRIANCVLTLSQTVSALTTKIKSVEQIVGSLAARVATLETSPASASSGSGSARSWNLLGQTDGSPATRSLGSHGPGSDDNRNTRRRLDTF